MIFHLLWLLYDGVFSYFLGFYFKMEPLSHKKLDFEEFCVAAISTYQLEALEGWEKIASAAFECFEREGNRVISVEELAQVCTSVLQNLTLLILFSN